MDTAALTNLLTAASLIAVMLAMGLKATVGEVLSSARRTRVVVLSLLGNFVLVPLVTFLLLFAFGANPLVSVGFFVLAVSPGAPVGPPLTAVARGDVPLSIAMMIILAVLSAILSPALLGLVVPWIASSSDLHIDYMAIVRTLLVTQLLPMACGLGIRHWIPAFAKLIVRPVGLLANVMLLILVCLIVAAQYELLAAIRIRAWAGMSLLLVASLGIGWFSAGSDPAGRKSMAMTTASRNVAVGLVIANRNFADTPAVIAVVAYGLFCIFGTLGCAMLLRKKCN